MFCRLLLYHMRGVHCAHWWKRTQAEMRTISICTPNKAGGGGSNANDGGAGSRGRSLREQNAFGLGAPCCREIFRRKMTFATIIADAVAGFWEAIYHVIYIYTCIYTRILLLYAFSAVNRKPDNREIFHDAKQWVRWPRALAIENDDSYRFYCYCYYYHYASYYVIGHHRRWIRRESARTAWQCFIMRVYNVLYDAQNNLTHNDTTCYTGPVVVYVQGRRHGRRVSDMKRKRLIIVIKTGRLTRATYAG